VDRLIANPTIAVISDLHIGEGNKSLDQFVSDAEFGRLLLDVIPKRFGPKTSLVINGDFVDFPQIAPSVGRHYLGDRLGATAAESVRRMQLAIAAHPAVFTNLQKYIERGGQVVLLAGNHDPEFYWPDVLGALRSAIGGAKEQDFRFIEQGELHERSIHIEHGHQYSFDNRFNSWPNPIVQAPDGRRLERPWGTLFLDLVYNQIESLWPFVHIVHPHSRLAWLALSHFADKEEVPIAVLAKLCAFFLAKGKRLILGRLLGPPDQHDEVQMDSSEGLLERLLDTVAPKLSSSQRKSIMAETMALLLDSAGETEIYKDEAAPTGLLGQTDERGLSRRTKELLTQGDITIVAYGHTHVAVNGNLPKERLFAPDDPRRVFNTGSWMPSVALGQLESISWKELTSRKRTHELYYLAIDCNDAPQANLELLNSY